jgi:hypothetical protein
MSLPTIQKAWSTALNFLTKGQRLKSTEIIADDLFQIGTGSALSQRMSKPVMQLIKSAQQFEVQGSAQVAEKIIGLGPGDRIPCRLMEHGGTARQAIIFRPFVWK